MGVGAECGWGGGGGGGVGGVGGGGEWRREGQFAEGTARLLGALTLFSGRRTGINYCVYC